MSASTSTNQYRLNLVSLECIRRQDTIGKDEPKVFVNGVLKFGPGNMGKGDVVDLRPRNALFTSTANIQLKEQDQHSDDDLGTVTATSADVDQGQLQGEYSRPNADYKITYEVVPA
jgi:hypothetical protein